MGPRGFALDLRGLLDTDMLAHIGVLEQHVGGRTTRGSNANGFGLWWNIGFRPIFHQNVHGLTWGDLHWFTSLTQAFRVAYTNKLVSKKQRKPLLTQFDYHRPSANHRGPNVTPMRFRVGITLGMSISCMMWIQESDFLTIQNKELPDVLVHGL